MHLRVRNDQILINFPRTKFKYEWKRYSALCIWILFLFVSETFFYFPDWKSWCENSWQQHRIYFHMVNLTNALFLKIAFVVRHFHFWIEQKIHSLKKKKEINRKRKIASNRKWRPDDERKVNPVYRVKWFITCIKITKKKNYVEQGTLITNVCSLWGATHNSEKHYERRKCIKSVGKEQQFYVLCIQFLASKSHVFSFSWNIIIRQK